MTNRLALMEEAHVRTWHDGKYVRRPESHFLDFVVDGASLRSKAPDAADLVTDLNRAWRPVFVAESVEVLLGRRPHRDLGPGRIPVLVCGSCGGLDCGALTARLTVAAAEVLWSDWRWVDHEGEHDIASELDDYAFDRAAYDATIGGAAERVSQMPYDDLPHRGKGFLWPWQWGWKLP